MELGPKPWTQFDFWDRYYNQDQDAIAADMLLAAKMYE
jgi:hypothetical protein